ncbi:MAG: pyridoxamine 5'-phosphate oxidase family protein [Candidatus Methanomethylophilaceae archaeon]
MRRSDREIVGKEDIVTVMRDCDVCRIAFATAGVPYILPLNFGISAGDGGMPVLYFHGAKEGTKYGLMEKDPNVSFEMDCSHRLVIDEEKGMCTMEYRSVIGRGILSEVTGDEKVSALKCILEHYGRGDLPFSPDVVRVLRLDVTDMTGKARVTGRP